MGQDGAGAPGKVTFYDKIELNGITLPLNFIYKNKEYFHCANVPSIFMLQMPSRGEWLIYSIKVAVAVQLRKSKKQEIPKNSKL